MRDGSMPNSATLSSRVDTAAKCLLTAASPSCATTYARALAAFAIVSCVVKVLEDTINSVCARSRLDSVSAISAPSTLETKCVRGPPCEKGDSALAAMAGPRSEPPMPILTTSENGSPVAPLRLLSRTEVANA